VDNIRIDLGEIRCGGVDWIGLAQDIDECKALVSLVMNLRFHKMLGNYRVASHLVASRVVLSSLELVSLLYLLIKCWYKFGKSSEWNGVIKLHVGTYWRIWRG
jgi:hypothetical protein